MSENKFGAENDVLRAMFFLSDGCGFDAYTLSDVYRFDAYTLSDVYRFDAYLTSTEYRILRLLLAHPKQIFSAQNIYESVWEKPFFSTDKNSVMVFIRKLRDKIEDDSRHPIHLVTVWGKGYRIE